MDFHLSIKMILVIHLVMNNKVELSYLIPFRQFDVFKFTFLVLSFVYVPNLNA